VFWPAVVVIAVTTAAAPLLHARAIELGHLALFQDDFFCYLAIARNLAAHGASTFDFTGLTNGYHPLWMAVLTALAALADTRSVTFVIPSRPWSSCWSWPPPHLFRRLVRSAFAEAPAAQDAGGLLFAFLYANLTRTGMGGHHCGSRNTGPTLAFLALPRAPSLSAAGLLCSIAILSRLDAAIFVAVLVVAILVFDERSRVCALVRLLSTPRAITGALGALPLAGYMALNLTVFGMLLPQSSAAKQIKASFSFNPRVMGFFVTLRDNARDQVFSFLMSTLPLLLGLVSSVLLVSGFVHSRRARIVVASTNGVALLYYTLLSFISDRNPWIWYLYAIILAGGVGAVRLFAVGPRGAVGLGPWGTRLGPPLLALVLVSLTIGSVVTVNSAGNPIHRSALRITEFARTHPGIYGMGDRGGLAGFLLPRGLVSSKGWSATRPSWT
jgi:hypothetical protein